MKKWIFMLGLILLLGGNNCWATAIVQTTDYISFPVVALDSLTGVECVPESVHIHVWRGSLTNTTVYSFRETGDGADLAQIDSVATGYAGAVPQQYYFHDQVQDIDGDGTAGVYTINVRLWRGTTPTSNWFSFQILTNSLNDAITAVTVTLDDSMGSAKHEAILTNPVVDGIKVKSDSLNFQGLARGTGLAVSMEKIMRDSVTSYNLEQAFDGDTTWGSNPLFTLKRMFVRGEAAGEPALVLRGGPTGGLGLDITGGSDNGHAISAVGGNGLGCGAIFGSGGSGESPAAAHDIYLAGSHHFSGWMDSVSYVSSVSEQIASLQAYRGAGDDWRQHLLPFGQANNDSLRTFDGANCVATIYLWKDASDATVLDSITMKEW